VSDIVTLAHGSGGKLSHELVLDVFVSRFSDGEPDGLEDAAILRLPPGRPALTTDSYVIQPRFFPGGDIGKLAVCGTVNDLSMRGAVPLYLTAGFVLEEGLPLGDLRRIAASMAATAREAGVRVVAGDTKVVERGAADGVFINTAGLGVVADDIHISARNARPGDAILVSGAMGDHGLSIMTRREGLAFESPLMSDCAPLHDIVAALLAACPVHVLRDPTRGGLATALNELASASSVGIEVEDASIPVHDPVRAASELLGLDPLYVANEGKFIAIVPGDCADDALAALRRHPLGREAAVIGRVVEDHPGRVTLRTLLGTHRLLDMLAGEQLPRIC